MAEAPLPASLFGELHRTARRLMSDGVLWLVYELPPSPFDRRQTASLLFESDIAIRRVRNYPGDWRTLSDDELFALSWDI